MEIPENDVVEGNDEETRNPPIQKIEAARLERAPQQNGERGE